MEEMAMRKILSLIFVISIFIFYGCSSTEENPISDLPDEEEDYTLEIVQDSIVLYRGDSETLKINTNNISPMDIEYETKEEFVGTFNGVSVFAKHVGETMLYASFDEIRDSCVLKVLPKYTFFSEPICEWGETRKYIREKETRPVILDHVGGYTALAYRAGEGIINYNFSTPDSLLISASVSLSGNSVVDVMDFLLERYEYKEEMFISGNTKIVIDFGQGGSVDVSYTPLN